MLLIILDQYIRWSSQNIGSEAFEDNLLARHLAFNHRTVTE